MRKRLPALAILILMLALVVTPVFAQDYLFRVTKVVVNYFINKDGTASVEYTYTFANDPGGHVIDFVDIGLPNDNYDISSIMAEVNGKKVTDIQKSSYVDHGVAVGLGANSIQPGKTGTVYVWVPVINRVIYPSSQGGEKDYASIQFSPNFFGSQYVKGNTDMTVTLVLPPGMTETEPRYYPPKNWPGGQEPKSGISQDGRVFYTWQSGSASSSTEYIFGAGFPVKLVPENTIVKAPLINFNIPFETICCFGFFAMIAGVIGLSVWSAQRRKLAYLPPKISMEGHGIKRGLTAVEAAVLMEKPVDQVLTMVLFSVIKKGAARVTSREPLKLETLPNPTGELYTYESDFLRAFQIPDARARRTEMQDVIVGLVKSITEKMRGFSRKETVDYYQSIMQQAWQQVEQAQTPEVKSQKFEENMDWTMLDRQYNDRTREVFRTGPVFLPHWWGNWDPSFGGGRSSTSSQPSGSSGGGGVSLPTLPGADFAASMVNGVQSFAAGVVGDLAAFTGGVTNQTNPPPPPPKSSGGFGSGGGGHSCACACACAGCACACAGGGR